MAAFVGGNHTDPTSKQSGVTSNAGGDGDGQGKKGLSSNRYG